PPRPSALAPATPSALEAIVLRCLEKDPARRYATAAALAEDLERFLAGEPVAARVRWRPRSRAGVVVGLALVLALVLALGARYVRPAPSAGVSSIERLWSADSGDVRSLASDGERAYVAICGLAGRYAITAIPLAGGAPAALCDAPYVPLGLALRGPDL